MRNKKLFITIISLLVIFAVIFTFNQVKQVMKDPLQKYVEEVTDFDIYAFENKNGIVDIALETLDTPHWTREDFIQLETRIIYDAVKHFPTEDISAFKYITVRFVTEKTSREISKISVSGDTLINKNWEEVENHQLESNVDSYFYEP
jgi:hypothetical protein